MSQRSMLPLVFLLALFVALASPRAQARSEGGSDIGVSGGGGTFHRCPRAGTPYSYYAFWDLYPTCGTEPEKEGPGDRHSFTNRGAQERGEWFDVRKLKSYRLLLRQVKAWAKWAPRFSAIVQETLRREPLVLGTLHHIQRVNELQVAPGFGDGYVVPGAYYDYDSGILFVDVGVWDSAGIHSQAAMLLHEVLRRVQPRFGIRNGVLQQIVRRAIVVSPEWNFNAELRYPWLACYRVPDSAFDPAKDRGANEPPPRSLPKTQASAEAAMRDALAKGLLGPAEMVVHPSTDGRFRNQPSPRGPRHEGDIMNSCLDSRPDEDFD